MTEQKQKQQQQQSNWPLENIRVPGDHDVIFGRGGASIHHAGCKAYRELVRSHQRQYIGYDDSRHMKTLLTHELVKKWRDQSPPGRFLKKDEKTGLWSDVGVKIARRKTAQLLREGAKQVRKEMRAETEASSSSSSEDEHEEEYAGSVPPAKKKQKRVQQPNQQESLCSTPPTLPRQSPVPVTPPGPVVASSSFHMMAPPTLPRGPPPAIPRPAPMEITTSAVQLANLRADLKSFARTAPPTVFSSTYGQPKNSTEMLEIIFEDILDDTAANPQQGATTSS